MKRTVPCPAPKLLYVVRSNQIPSEPLLPIHRVSKLHSLPHLITNVASLWPFGSADFRFYDIFLLVRAVALLSNGVNRSIFYATSYVISVPLFIVPPPIVLTWKYIMWDTWLFHSFLHLFTIPSFLTLSILVFSSSSSSIHFSCLQNSACPPSILCTSLVGVLRTAHKMVVKNVMGRHCLGAQP